MGAALLAEAPLLVPVALAIGIGLWFGLPWNGQRQAALLGALALGVCALALPGGWRRLALWAGLLVALGLVVAEYRSAQVAAPKLHHRLTAAEIRGTLLDVTPHEAGARLSLLLLRDASAIDPPVRVRISVPGALPPGMVPGARLAVEATLGPVPGPALPGAHDPARRAWFEGVGATGRATGPPRLLAPAPGGFQPLAGTRAWLERELPAALGGDAGALALALTVGQQGLIRPELVDAMRVAGLAHILTVSGFHVGVVVAGVFALARLALGLWPWLALRLSVRRIAAVIAGLAGTCYVLLAGADVPAVRAAIAAWVVLLALMLGRDPVSLRLVAFAALLILLVRPEALLNPSFQLSFAAVTALAALARSPLGRRLAPDRAAGLLPRAARLLAGMLLAGLVAELALMPIVLFHFGRAGAYGLVANLAAVPLTSFVILPLLGAWLLLAPLGAGWLVEWALAPALTLLGQIGLMVAGWPGATVGLAAMPLAALLAMVAGGLLLALLVGPARWAGLVPIGVGVALALLLPRPDLFVSGDGRQVGLVRDGALYLLAGHRGGFLVRSWQEQADPAGIRPMAALPGARCSAGGCLVELGQGHRLLALRGDEPPAGPLPCGRVDLVTAPHRLNGCAPRRALLDARALATSGAVSIHSATGRLDSVAARAGDQPWSPSALPGRRPRLLGAPAWTGVIAE